MLKNLRPFVLEIRRKKKKKEEKEEEEENLNFKNTKLKEAKI